VCASGVVQEGVMIILLLSHFLLIFDLSERFHSN
jgi:hypothetical protein